MSRPPVVRALRHALHSLAGSPGYTASAIVILTLGIGVNTTVFSLVNALFLRPPAHVVEPESVVTAVRVLKTSRTTVWTFPDYDFFRQQARALSGLAAHSTPRVMTAGLGDSLRTVRAVYASDNYFSLLGVRPRAGRAFLPEDNQVPAGQAVAVVSHGFWQRALRGRRGAVGTTIQLNGHPVTVVGVASRGFSGLSPAEQAPDLWVPIAQQPVLTPGTGNALRRQPGYMMAWLQVFGRLGPGVALDAAQADLAAASRRLGEEVPAWAARGDGVELVASYRFNPRLGQSLARLLRLLGTVTAAVLAIALVNLALLLLARASSQSRLAGIRLALGASRRRVAGELLLESLLLALAGGVAAVLAAFWSAGLAGRALPFALGVSFAPDLRVLAVTLGLALASAALFGLLPALHGARTEVLSVIHRGQGRGGWARLREALVVAQVALAVPLAAGAGLFVASLRQASRVDLGYASDHRLFASMALSQHGYSPHQARQLAERARERLSALPGVELVSTMAVPPFSGMIGDAVVAEGRPVEEQVEVEVNFVGPELLRAMRIRLLAGRDVAPTDLAGTEPVAVVSRAAAERLWPGQDPLGKRLLAMGETRTVVGVAADTRVQRLDEVASPRVYLPAQQAGGADFSLLVVTAVPPESLAGAVEKEIHALDPRIAITDLRSLESVVGQVLGNHRVAATLVGTFAALALLLTATGLYGVLAYRVARGQRRIGVEMALGASRAEIARSVLRHGLLLAAWGLPIGLGLAWAGARLVESFLFQVEARDPANLFLTSILVLSVVVLASWLPAWRAARVEPVEALREE